MVNIILSPPYLSPKKDIYIVPFNEIKRFLKTIDYPDMTGNVPIFAHLILDSFELNPVEKYDVFEETKTVEDKYELIAPSNKFLLKVFLDPISGQHFKDPVNTSSGYTFERAFVESWIANRKTDPMTGDSLGECVPSIALKELLPHLKIDKVENLGKKINTLLPFLYKDLKTIDYSVKKYLEAHRRNLAPQSDLAIFIEMAFKINDITMYE